jgi:hypothetical protein
VKGNEYYPSCISRKLTEVPVDVRSFLSTGLNHSQRVSDFTVSNSVLAEDFIAWFILDLCMIIPFSHKMDISSHYEIGKIMTAPRKSKCHAYCCMILMI